MDVEVISLGGSLLFNGLDVNYTYLNKLKRLLTSYPGKRFVIVVGGGSIARTYMTALEHFNSNKEFVSHFGIAITRTNARLVANAFGRLSNTRTLPKSLKEVKHLLTKHKIVCCGGLRYADNQTSDGTAAQLARYLRTRFINLTNVKGLCTKDPHKYKGAKLIPRISYREFDKEVRKLSFHPGQHFVLDHHSSTIIHKGKVPTTILGSNLTNVKRFLDGKSFIGTTIN